MEKPEGPVFSPLYCPVKPNGHCESMLDYLAGLRNYSDKKIRPNDFFLMDFYFMLGLPELEGGYTILDRGEH